MKQQNRAEKKLEHKATGKGQHQPVPRGKPTQDWVNGTGGLWLGGQGYEKQGVTEGGSSKDPPPLGGHAGEPVLGKTAV